ncbi:MAG: glycoside hydrolase family 9 protein [Porcipelethomonas sp.]
MKRSKLFRRLKAAAVGVAVSAAAIAAPAAMPEQNADAATEVNFAKALQYSLYLYDANMCGPNVGETSQLDWRDDCHTYDSSVSTPYGTLDLSGGFHDAGDHVKFGLPGSYSATMLGWGYYEFKDAFVQIGEADHLRTITDYFCDYFKRCTVMSGSTVQAYCYQVGDGDTDHNEWMPPEDQTLARPVYFATSSNPCTDVVAETAAALAMNYVNFGNTEDLTYAKALYNFAKSNNKAAHSEQSYYVSDSYLDDLALASIILYKATNDSSYKTDCASWISQSNYAYTSDWPLCWGSVWPAVNAIYANEWSRVSENLDKNKNGYTTSEGYYSRDSWGSARYNTACQLVGLVYDKYNNSSTYGAWAKTQMEYLFGSNKNNQCYMVGYDTNSVTHPHHRAATGFTGFPSENQGKEHANVLVGALVGGPDSSGNYVDETEQYTYTEVATDYNAAFVGALAGLYLKYGSGQSPASSVPGVSGGSTPVVTTPAVTTAVTTKATTVTTTVSTTKAATTVTTTKSSGAGEITLVSTAATTSTTAKTTSAPTGSGSQSVSVNSSVDYTDDNSKNCNIPLSDILPEGAKAKQIIVNLTAGGDIGTISCGGGIAADTWISLSVTSQSGTGSSVQVLFDVSQYSDVIDSDDLFQFSYWWGSQQSVTVDSVICVYEGGTSAVTTTTTAATTAKTTSSTTASSTTKATTAAAATTTTTGSSVIDEIDWSRVIYGDVDLNGKVSVSDTVRLAKYLASKTLYPLNATAVENADCLYDNVIDARDGQRLIEFCLGLVFSLGK